MCTLKRFDILQIKKVEKKSVCRAKHNNSIDQSSSI